MAHQQKSNIDNPSLLICRISILVDSNIWVSLYRRASNLTSLTTVSDIVRQGICGRLRRTRMSTRLYSQYDTGIAAAVIDVSLRRLAICVSWRRNPCFN